MGVVPYTVLLVLAVASIGLGIAAFFQPAVTMNLAETDCPDAGTRDDCMERHTELAWHLRGEDRTVQQVHYENGSVASSGTEAQERTWREPQLAASPGAATASRGADLAFLALGLAFLGLVLAVAGALAHPAAGVLGGVLLIGAMPAAGAGALMLWLGSVDLGAAVRRPVAAGDLTWASVGPWWSPGLTLLLACGAAAVAAGVIACFPKAYPRRQ